MAWPAVIGALGSIAGSFISNASNRRNERKMWQRNNEYNHPLMQMQRLREAGLNPHLVYGQSAGGASGNSASPASSDDLQLNNNFFEYLSQYVGSKKQETEIDNLERQREVMTADIALKGSQQASNEANTARSKFDLSQAERLKDISVQAAIENLHNIQRSGVKIDREVDKLIEDTALSATNRKVSEQTIRESQQRIRESQDRIRTAIIDRDGKKLDNEIRKIELNLRKLGINPNDPAGHRILGRVLEESGMADKAIDAVRGAGNWIKDFLFKPQR